MIIAKTRKRIQVISIGGRLAERYFAVTSEMPRKIVDARISAMPLNGRSARAGAFRAADFFSGMGMGALSSRAAVAIGGFTAISMVVISTRARLHKTRKPPNPQGTPAGCRYARLCRCNTLLRTVFRLVNRA